MKFTYLRKMVVYFHDFLYLENLPVKIYRKKMKKHQITLMGRRIIFVKLGNSVSVNISLNTNK